MPEMVQPNQLHNYVIRPGTQDIGEIRKLCAKINQQLKDKKLLDQCALEHESVIWAEELSNGLPVLRIKCTKEVAKLISNLPSVMRLESAKGRL